MQWFWAWSLQIWITERKKRPWSKRVNSKLTGIEPETFCPWLINDHVTRILTSYWSVQVTWPEYWPLIGQYLVNQDGRVTLPCRAHGQAGGGVPGDGKILTAHKNYAFGKMLNESKLDQFSMLCPANAVDFELLVYNYGSLKAKKREEKKTGIWTWDFLSVTQYSYP